MEKTTDHVNHGFKTHKKLFHILQLFFCGRSDYFRALLEYKYSESLSPEKELLSKSIPEIYLNDVTPDVFAAVVAFIYQDDALVRLLRVSSENKAINPLTRDSNQ